MDIIQGTLDMLVLQALRSGPKHGWDVLNWLNDVSGRRLSAEEGAIYPALYRMEERGLVESTWGVSENNRRAKFYALTARGRTELTARSATWNQYVDVVRDILGETS